MKKLYAIIAFCLFISYTTFSQTISSNAPLCGNQNLTLDLSATGGTAYAWKGPNGFASTLQKPSIKNVNWKNRGVYTVTIDNKTTLTTDINIKDPVAFTVPKEISVCEGGTLIIEPKSGRLTDSTEVPWYYTFISPNRDEKDDFYLAIKNFSKNNIGEYKIVGNETQTGCSTTQIIKVNLSNKTNCKTIQIEDLSKVKVCYEQEVSIPFMTTGDFKQGTKFSVYILNYNESLNSSIKPDAIVEKSPVIFSKIPYKFWDGRFKIVIVADDVEKTTTISERRNYLNNFSSVYIQSASTCDSVKLINSNDDYYKNYISSYQWILDGQSIKSANRPDFTAKKSGTYTLQLSYNNQYYKVDNTCIFESQPIKIELGKIPKPFVSVSNDIELCVGKPATLNVSQNTNTTYRWKKDGAFITNATKANFETLQEGKYQIEAKEGTCTAVSDTVVLKKPERLKNLSFYVNTGLPIYEQKDVYTLCNNQEVKLNYSIENPLGSVKEPRILEGFKTQLLKDGKVIRESLLNVNGSGEYRLKEDGIFNLKVNYGTCSDISKPINVKYSKYVRGETYLRNNNLQACEGNNLGFKLFFNAGYNKLEKGYVYKDGKIIQDWDVETYSETSYYTIAKIQESGKYYAVGKVIFPDNSECSVVTDTINVLFSKRIVNQDYYFDPKIKAVPIAVCRDTVTIYAYNNIGTYGRNLSYRWTKDGVVLKQDSSEVLETTQSGIYQLETTYKGGCTVISSPYKVELGKLQVGFTHDLNEAVCDGDLYYLEPTLNENSIGAIWDFYKNGQLLTSNVKNIYGIALTQSGTYKLTVKNGKCEGTSPDFVLKVDKIPTTITPTDSVTFCAGKTVELKASTEAGLSYIWERNGSVISQANQATLTASADGLYKATLLRGACWGVTPSVKLKSLANILPTATLTGDKKINLDEETKLSVNLTSHAPWTFKLSDGKEYTATKSSFDIAVKPLSTTTYSLTEVSNICGTGTVSGTAKIEIIILSAEEERDLSVEVFPVPSSEICHWKIQTPQATNASVMLYDVLGVSQYSQASSIRSQTHEGTIDLTNMKAGTYFLKLQAGEKSVIRKVVKY